MRAPGRPLAWTCALSLAPAVAGLLAWTLWLRPEAPGEWFPLRVGDRWVYRDGAGNVVFEVVKESRLIGAPAFLVERRIGPERTDFLLSLQDGVVLVHATSKGIFTPPFPEFILPPVEGARWSYEGRFTWSDLRIESQVRSVSANACEIAEESGLGYTRFRLRRGVGVVELEGKQNDLHGGSPAGFHWTLERFKRR